jgi:hypothetical protein
MLFAMSPVVVVMILFTLLFLVGGIATLAGRLVKFRQSACTGYDMVESGACRRVICDMPCLLLGLRFHDAVPLSETIRTPDRDCSGFVVGRSNELCRLVPDKQKQIETKDI